MRHLARHLGRHFAATLAAACALAVLPLGAGLLPGALIPSSGTALAMGGKPDASQQRQTQTGRLGSVAPAAPLLGQDMAGGQMDFAGGAAEEPARSGVFGSAFIGTVRGLLSGMTDCMHALSEASPPGGAMGGMGSMGGMASPQAPADRPNSGLLGTWEAPNGISPLAIQLRAGGACTLFDKGQTVAGSWDAAGSMISLRFANGRTFALRFSVEGDHLALSDGSFLQRQPNAGIDPPQASTDPKDLVGSWRAWNGSYAVVLVLDQKTCTLNANAKEFKGRWKASKGRLHLAFDSGPPLAMRFAVEGNVLRLADGTLLLRQ